MTKKRTVKKTAKPKTKPVEKNLTFPTILPKEHSKVKYRFHIPGLPHTRTTKEFNACFSDDTEILTAKGWMLLKTYVQSHCRTPVATLNIEKNIVEYQRPSAYHEYDYAGKMFHQDSTNINFKVTPNHRLLLRTHNDAKLNRPYQYLTPLEAPKGVQYKRSFPWQNQPDKETFLLPSYTAINTRFRPEVSIKMDDWLRLMGIYLAEGWSYGTPYATNDAPAKTVHSCHTIGIAQEKTASQGIMQEWLDKLPFKTTYNGKAFLIHDVQLAEYLRQFGKAKEKFIPNEFKSLSKRQLKILLDALILGDGWETGSCRRYVSYSKRLADDVAEIALKVGYIVTQYDDPNPETPRHIVTLSSNLPEPFVNNNQNDDRKWEICTGKVYCLTVPNGNLYVRRNGKGCWLGNCAYTMKVWKLCKMLTDAGHTVYHYGAEGSNPVCTEHVDVVTDELFSRFCNYDWHKEYFRFDATDELHQTFFANAVREIRKRAQPKDFLLCAWGFGHQPIAVGVEDMCMVVESGIGYAATFAKFRVFESSPWMQWIYGQDKQDNGSWYDCVIPNFFDPEDFRFQEKKGDYFLYMGRLIKRKGVEVAFQITKEIGAKLILAGQGQLVDPREQHDLRSDHVEFVGYADVEKRKELMAGARALIAPTYYIEPFGGVTIEASFSGTPVITTDWGVFPETVLHGVTGYRCRTFEQFCWAAKNIETISPANCRKWAEQNFSCERVTHMYEEYFYQLQNLYKGGWYEPNPGRTQLDWLRKRYPIL